MVIWNSILGKGFYKDEVVADFSTTTHLFVHRDQWAAEKLESS
jgi:hypothetical protein